MQYNFPQPIVISSLFSQIIFLSPLFSDILSFSVTLIQVH
jgi:hypothetical protein